LGQLIYDAAFSCPGWTSDTYNWYGMQLQTFKQLAAAADVVFYQTDGPGNCGCFAGFYLLG
jgi:hypothetical protein